MKVNGTDPLIKLLLELNNQNLKMPPSNEKVNLENLSKQVEKILIQRDEVILRGDSLLKPDEIQYTRQLHETPEAYLQRISTEMIKMKESQNNIQEERQLLQQNDEAVDIALRAGLHKEYVDQNKLKKSIARDTKETRWLLILSVSFIVVLIIYLIFRK